MVSAMPTDRVRIDAIASGDHALGHAMDQRKLDGDTPLVLADRTPPTAFSHDPLVALTLPLKLI
jgi:hypothetical protein